MFMIIIQILPDSKLIKHMANFKTLGSSQWKVLSRPQRSNNLKTKRHISIKWHRFDDHVARVSLLHSCFHRKGGNGQCLSRDARALLLLWSCLCCAFHCDTFDPGCQRRAWGNLHQKRPWIFHDFHMGVFCTCSQQSFETVVEQVWFRSTHCPRVGRFSFRRQPEIAWSRCNFMTASESYERWTMMLVWGWDGFITS